MATYYQVTQDQRGTPRIVMAANTEVVVQFVDDVADVAVTSLDGLAPIWWNLDGATATVDSLTCMVIPPAITRATDTPRGSGPTEVHLISSGTPTVVVGRV